MAKRKAYQRTGALCFAVGVHAALFGFFFAVSDHAPSTQRAFSDQASMSVSLVGPLNGPARLMAQPSSLDLLRQRLVAQSDQAANTSDTRSASQTPDVLKELDNQARASGPASAVVGKKSVKSLSTTGKNQTGEDPWAHASASYVVNIDTARTGLWPQIARCWRPPHVNVVVKLSVTLTDRGLVAAPPVVVHESAVRVDPARLAAEAEAKRALTSCSPYAVAPGSPRSFELDFAGGGAG